MLLCISLLRFSSSRDSNSRRERYDNSYRSRPAFREREREIDSDMRMYDKIRFVLPIIICLNIILSMTIV